MCSACVISCNQMHGLNAGTQVLKRFMIIAYSCNKDYPEEIWSAKRHVKRAIMLTFLCQLAKHTFATVQGLGHRGWTSKPLHCNPKRIVSCWSDCIHAPGGGLHTVAAAAVANNQNVVDRMGGQAVVEQLLHPLDDRGITRKYR